MRFWLKCSIWKHFTKRSKSVLSCKSAIAIIGLLRPQPRLAPEIRRHLPADHPNNQRQQNKADREPDIHEQNEDEQKNEGQRMPVR